VHGCEYSDNDGAGIVAYTHFKIQEQRVERQLKADMEELVVCNGLRTPATVGSPSVESDSLIDTDVQD